MKNRFIVAALIGVAVASSPALASRLGIFSAHQDIGSVKKKGSAKFDRKKNTYTVTGGGQNIWGKQDAFQYVYDQVSGDVSLTTSVKWVVQGVEGHRKAGIMLRADLTAESPYVDVMVHGDGTASLQYRLAVGDVTKEVRSEVKFPKVIRLQRVGDQVSMAVGESADGLKTTGPVTIHLGDPVYVGFAVCAHNNNLKETAVFKDPKIATGAGLTQ